MRSTALRRGRDSHAPVNEARIAELEPGLAGRFRKGLFFVDEGHLDPRVALSALSERLRAKGGEVRFGADGEAFGGAEVLVLIAAVKYMPARSSLTSVACAAR